MTTTIEVDTETAERIDALVARTGMDRAALLRMLVENGMEDVEDYFAAIEIRDRIRRGEERTYTDAEVRAELGLDD